MSGLSQEEKNKIIEEEKLRAEVRKQLEQESPPPNKKAKDGLVLALGSVIVGYLFGIPAIIYGINGIKHAKKYPAAGGGGLSKFNLILGSITTAAYLFLTWHFMSQ